MQEKQTGGISVNTENIFPIIKKWLYSEKDIFLRELVSNACDAVTKLRRLQSLGEAPEAPEAFRIDVRLSKTAKTLTVEDNGIGMTEEELQRYICSIALSGAVDFLQKYEGEGDASKNGIIGHFGLGFYSAFMVSDKVEIFTRSYTGAPAVHWTCNAEGCYEIEQDEREERGTRIVVHVTDEEAAYLESHKILDMLNKYCAFMPVEIYFDDGEDKEGEQTPINETTPLWQRSPAEASEEDYKTFYQKLFADFREPLFHIHINADYPLNFKGILYFPRINNNYEPLDGQIKLYYNQVFVSDSIKEVLPDYLLMLRGVLDCPELPLNVSRSYLQNNSYINKVSAHIVKKVADKLAAMARDDREQYEKLWADIKTFVEFAAMRDSKFRDRTKDAVLFKLVDGKHVTLAEYLEGREEKNVYYTTDPSMQAQYVALCLQQGFAVVEFDGMLDTQFASMLEADGEGVKFLRVDAAAANACKAQEAPENSELCDLFKKAVGNDRLNVVMGSFQDGSVPVVLSASEESRRMEDMMRLYRLSGGEGDEMPSMLDETLTLNAASPLIGKLDALRINDPEAALGYATHLYRLAVLSQRKMSAEEMQSFLADCYRMLTDLI